MRKTFPRHYLIIALLGLLGYLGNILDIPIAFGVSFIFGSIFSIVAVSNYGTGPGLLVSLIASSYTYTLWNHPYAIVIFFCEILWIGLFLRYRKTNFLLIDLTFWLFLGCPLVFVFYGNVMGLGLQQVLLIALKQSINGTLNTLLAWTLLSLPFVFDRFGIPFSKRQISSEHVIFQVSGLFLLIPSLAMLLLFTQREITKSQEEVIQALQSDSATTANNLGEWVEHHVLATKLINELVTEDGKHAFSSNLQNQLAKIHGILPDFHNIFLGDKNAKVIAVHPPMITSAETALDGTFEHQNWFKELKHTLRPIVSDVLTDQSGVPLPFFMIIAPNMQDGELSFFLSGTIYLEKISKILGLTGHDHNRIFTVVDRHQNVLVGSNNYSGPMRDAESFATSTHIPVGGDVILVVPGRKSSSSTMESYKDAYYFTRQAIPGTSWYLDAEYPVKPLQYNYYHSAIQGMAVILILLIFLAFVISILSRWLTTSLQDLAQVTVDLPLKIENKESVCWPSSRIEEVSQLISNFQLSAEGLAKSFAKTHRINLQLEEAVVKRTQELQEERQRLAEVLNEQAIILENTTVGITMVRQRRQVWHNPAMLELLGYSDAEVQNVPTSMFYRSKEEYEKIGAEAYPALSRGEAYHSEIFLRRADGSDVEVSLHGRAVNPHSPQDGSIWIFEDISDRKQMEAEREKLILELRTALKEVKTLGSMLPICSSCKKIRDDEGYWKRLDEYLREHTGAEFSHGMCNDCMDKLYGNEDWYKKSRNQKRE